MRVRKRRCTENILFLFAGIVVITDGVVGIPEANLLELLLTQLRNSTISCSFLKVGSALNIQHQFGHVPNYELMQFIATATFGGFFMSCPDVVSRSSLPTCYFNTTKVTMVTKIEGNACGGGGEKKNADLICSLSLHMKHTLCS